MDVMISLQCASSESIAKELNTYLRGRGLSTWICIEMDGGATYREEIVVNASGSKTLVALMNSRWAESKECRYEFNIATRSNLTKGYPQIIPVMLENFDFHKYPLITGVMANTNAIFYNPKDPSDTWGKVTAAVQSYVLASSPDTGTAPGSVSVPVQVFEPLPEKMTEWQITHVAQWVQSLNLPGSPKDAFINNWVDGPMLMDITQQELQDHLKFTGLQAKRFMRELQDFKSKRAAPIAAATPSKVQRLGGSLFKVGHTVSSTMISAATSRSKKGFVTGIWEGFYDYDSGARDKMSMDVTMIGGLIAGFGADAVGDFNVIGKYDDDQLTCSWEKSYYGKHSLYYNGKLEEQGKVIKGKWEVPDSWSGRFELSLKKK